LPSVKDSRADAAIHVDAALANVVERRLVGPEIAVDEHNACREVSKQFLSFFCGDRRRSQ
jgi:hypothetical protein